MTPGTEAPAEMNFYFPDHRALCMAENATHTLHNLLTLRGARCATRALVALPRPRRSTLFAADSDVVFASHHWPTWGAEPRRIPSRSATCTATCTTRPCG